MLTAHAYRNKNAENLTSRWSRVAAPLFIYFIFSFFGFFQCDFSIRANQAVMAYGRIIKSGPEFVKNNEVSRPVYLRDRQRRGGLLSRRGWRSIRPIRMRTVATNDRERLQTFTPLMIGWGFWGNEKDSQREREVT